MLTAQYATPLHSYFVRRLHDQSEAQDLVQEVFLRLARLDGVSELREPARYLFAVARSALNDKYRRERVRQRESHQVFEDSEHPSSVYSPECVMEGREAMQLIHATLTGLPERTRDAFVLRVFEDMRMADVAKALGVSQRSAEKHCARALGRVAMALRDYRNA